MSDFINNLKVGDEVAVNVARFGKANYKIFKVSSITKTGRINVADDDEDIFQFDKFGVKTIDRWHFFVIEEPTQDIRDEIKKELLLNKIKKLDFSKLSINVLNDIIKVVQNG